MPQNFYELIWLFLIYAFFGWCMEVAYAAMERGIFVNRGFLNGPYCPIYGCGMIIVVQVLYPLRDNFAILFIGSFILTSVLEYFTGFFLEKIFHNKWWDYSNLPFNIKGYVCLKFSIYWGLAGMFVIDMVHPVIYGFVKHMPHFIGIIIVSVIMLAFIVDCGITVSTILKFNKRLKMLDEIAQRLHKISDEIGENIYENVENALEKTEEFQKNHEELMLKVANKKEEMKKEREELEHKYKDLLEKKGFGFKRLMKAFPGMTSKERNESLQKYKAQFHIGRTINRKGKSNDTGN